MYIDTSGKYLTSIHFRVGEHSIQIVDDSEVIKQLATDSTVFASYLAEQVKQKFILPLMFTEIETAIWVKPVDLEE